MDLSIRIFLITVTVLIALIIGLILRRRLVRRLKNTVLDKWLVQTLGAIVIVILLLLAVPISIYLIDNTLIPILWLLFLAQVNLKDITGLAWNLVETLLLISLGVGIARTIRRLIVRNLGANRIDINIRTLVGRISYLLTLTLIVFWILAIWNISIGVPVAALGILTVAFTVAIQDVLKDLVAGLYILMEHPFHIGDQVTIGDQVNLAGHTGRVEDVQIRTTKLRLVSGEEVSVPNALVFSSIVINNSFYNERRATIIVTLPEEQFIKDATPKQILNTIKSIETILAKPEPTISLIGLSEKKISLDVRFWIAHGQFSTVTEIMYALHESLPDADLSVQESAGNV
jgi:small-conductance mechanosensitive channel